MKLWSTHRHPKHVEEACKNTLKKLGTDYLDLYLIHWPIAFKFNVLDMKEESEWCVINPKTKKVELEFVKVEDTWRAMEQLVEKGLVKSIGVSNFPITSVVDILCYAKIKPVINQVECMPYFNQEQMFDDLKQFDIKIEGYFS